MIFQILNVTEDYDYVDDIWGDEPDYEEYEENQRKIKIKRINFNKFGTKDNKTVDDNDIADSLPANIYCDLVTTLNTKCKESSLLEIWQYKEDLINTATQQEIIDAVNLLERSPWHGYEKDFSETLGGITRNSSGHIVAAKSELMIFVNKVDFSQVDLSQGVGSVLEFADDTNLAWETEFIERGLKESRDELKLLMLTPRSFTDISEDTVFFDAKFVVAGYSIMILFTILVLGKLNILEIRFYLTISGILSIIMGMVIGIGMSLLLGYPYTAVHIVLPFICLGKQSSIF